MSNRTDHPMTAPKQTPLDRAEAHVARCLQDVANYLPKDADIVLRRKIDWALAAAFDLGAETVRDHAATKLRNPFPPEQPAPRRVGAIDLR